MMQISSISVLVFLLLLISFPFVYADHTNHDFYKIITIESDDVDSNLTDFPLLLNFTDSDLQSNAFSDGLRITFTDSGLTELSHEIEQYTSGTGWLTAWVKVPSISSSTDTDIRMYYGNNTNLSDQQTITDTWRSEYVSVYHLNDDFLDSTSNNNDGTNSGSTDVSDEHIADSQNFDGINDNIDLGSGSSIDDVFDGGGTVTVWIKPDSDGESSAGRVYDKVQIDSFLDNESGGSTDVNIQQGFSGVTGTWGTTSRDITIGAWNHFAVSYDSDSVTNNPTFHIDGVIKTVGSGITESATPTGTRLTEASSNMIIGNNNATTRTFDGDTDEFRIYDGVLSTEWLDFEYCNSSATAICEPLTVSSQVVHSFTGNYDYAKKITIESDDVNSDLTNYPLLLNMTDTDLQSNAFSDGLRIMFADSTNTTQYSHEIEQYNSATGYLTAWIKIPTISSSSDTDFFMFYGNNTNVGDRTKETVWNDNIEAVILFSNTAEDYTSNNNDGTWQSGETYELGSIGYRGVFDGTSGSEINLANESNFDYGHTDQFSIDSWIETDASQSSFTGMITKSSSSGNGFYLTLDANNPAKLDFVIKGTSHYTLESSGGLEDISSTHLVVTFDGLSNTKGMKIYVNGTLVDTGADLAMTGSGLQDYPFTLGDWGLGNINFKGTIDDVGIWTSELSADWIDFEYCNEVNSATCEPLTVSGEEEITTTATHTIDVSEIQWIIDTDDVTLTEFFETHNIDVSEIQHIIDTDEVALTEFFETHTIDVSEIQWIIDTASVPNPDSTHTINVSEIQWIIDTDEVTLIEFTETHTIDVSEIQWIIDTDNVTITEGTDVHTINVSEIQWIIDTDNVTLTEGTDVHTIDVSEIQWIIDTDQVSLTEFTETHTIDVSEIQWIIDTASVPNADSTHTINVSEIQWIIDTGIASTDGSGAPYQPSGRYIWFNISPPTDERLGGVFLLDCGPGNYVQGILSNGTLICTALPP